MGIKWKPFIIFFFIIGVLWVLVGIIDADYQPEAISFGLLCMLPFAIYRLSLFQERLEEKDNKDDNQISIPNETQEKTKDERDKFFDPEDY